MLLSTITCLSLSAMTWGASGSPAQADRGTVADSILTDSVISRMVAFGNLYEKEPDSIKKKMGTHAKATAFLKQVKIPVGQRQVTVSYVDPGLQAAAYPSIAAAFKQAGLKPEQYGFYAMLFLSARASNHVSQFKPGERDLLGMLGVPLFFINWTTADRKLTPVEEANFKCQQAWEKAHKVELDDLPIMYDIW